MGNATGSSKKNRRAVTAFLANRYSSNDLKNFFSMYDPLAKVPTIVLKGDDGGELIAGGTESMLDAEYITSVAHNVQTEFWGFSGRAPKNVHNEPFLKWLIQVSKTDDATVPKVFSTSYGEDEDSVDPDYAARINVEFMKAGARGISLLFASGDSGAAGQGDCPGGKFQPSWPATSPFVTSVGGTENHGPETAAGLSSGGFSNRYETPKWQKEAVKGYFAQRNLPNEKYYNSSGRGFPDIAAQAMSYPVVIGKSSFDVDGTSCACPTAAAVISLLNDERLNEGKSTLGFLNPLLYSAPAAFNDITTGRNGGCGVVFGRGFPATNGWDAVTGLGTPNFVALKKVVNSLP